MNLLKTSFLSLISTSVKVASGIVINKAVSVFIGPSGLALIGQFQNILQIMMTLAQGGINSGVTKYTAEYNSSDENELPSLWSSAAIITLVCSGVIGLLSIFLSSYFSRAILHSSDYSYVFLILGVTFSLFTLNQLLLSIINGLKEIKLFITINITQSLYGLVFSTAMVILWGLEGALLALVTNQSVVFLIVVMRLRRHHRLKLSNFLKGFDLSKAKLLSSYTLMALTSAFTIPLSNYVVRNYIGESISWDAAGYWQAISYISSMYLMVVTTALSTYYLPRLSEISCTLELKRELRQGYKVIIPIVCVLSLSMYFCRGIIVWLLFSSEFEPMLDLFLWQLIGDVIKISSWLMVYLLLAKSMTKEYIFTEVFFSLLFTAFSIVLINFFGLIGVTYSYAISYFLYFTIVIYIILRKIN